jgi:hypothetical protein
LRFPSSAHSRAKIGGIVTQSSDPTIAVGMYGWFQVFDNGEGAHAAPVLPVGRAPEAGSL